MTKVFDSTWEAQRVSFADQNGDKVKCDVYYFEAAFWNAGNAGIEPSAIREPLTIIVSEASRILDWRILKQTKEAVAKFTIEDTQADDQKKLKVSWAHFDPGFGFRFFLLIEATPNQAPQVTLEGTFAESYEITDASPVFTKLPGNYVAPVFIVYILLLAVISYGLNRILDRATRGITWFTTKVGIAVYALLAGGLSYILLKLLSSVFVSGLEPPI